MTRRACERRLTSSFKVNLRAVLCVCVHVCVSARLKKMDTHSHSTPFFSALATYHTSWNGNTTRSRRDADLVAMCQVQKIVAHFPTNLVTFSLAINVSHIHTVATTNKDKESRRMGMIKNTSKHTRTTYANPRHQPATLVLIKLALTQTTLRLARAYSQLAACTRNTLHRGPLRDSVPALTLHPRSWDPSSHSSHGSTLTVGGG